MESRSAAPSMTATAVAMAASWLTMAAHNQAELPIHPRTPENVGPLIVAVLLLVAYQARPGWPVLLTILVWGLLNAIVGGIVSVLPLPILPFVPEQAIGHYTWHVVYTIGQLLLIALALAGLWRTRAVGEAGRP